MRDARAVIEELADRSAAGDLGVVDELVAVDMVNHAAGPQGREGWQQVLAVIEADLGPTTVQRGLTIAEGDLVTTQLTVHGTHRGSTMPLLAGVPVSGRPVASEFLHVWRVAAGQVVEHGACRDDVGLLAQVGAWPLPGR